MIGKSVNNILRIEKMADLNNVVLISWNPRLEQYFKEVAEKSNCLSWCHKKSEELFSNKTMYIDLPCIIIGSINGFISVGAKQIFPGDELSSLYIGIVALFVSLLNTISSYFSWSRRAENHKMSSLSYAKLYRFLSVQMSLPRQERISPTELLKFTQNEYNRLNETSALLPPSVIDTFKSRFKTLDNISLPSEVNGLHPVAIYGDENSIRIPAEEIPAHSPQVVIRTPDATMDILPRTPAP